MSNVITVENLGKKYTLHHQQREQYTALRDVISNGIRNLSKKILSPFTSNPAPLTPSQEDFWALKGVFFEVKQGDRIGIIGRNGAGKSTLLKILSRITEPTTGSVRIKGRVASLLEVGTGFHPELTGRENIFLNGAILGMGRAEIKKKFDEIVDFAEIEKFLDTPVKRYSSGMYVRLAFAVAAHLEPEILVVDEVLAVGDMAFQKKCLGKMNQISMQDERTILFVSHNMEAIRTLCNRGGVLDRGTIAFVGGINEAVACYTQSTKQSTIDESTSVWNEKVRRGSGSVRFTDIRIVNEDGLDTLEYKAGERVRFLLCYKCISSVSDLCLCIAFKSGQLTDTVTDIFHTVSASGLTEGQTGLLTLDLSTETFRPNEYRLYCWLGNSLRQPFDVVDELVGPIILYRSQTDDEFQIQSSGYFNVPSQVTHVPG